MKIRNVLSKLGLAAALAFGLAPVAANATCYDGNVYVNNTDTTGYGGAGYYDGSLRISDFCNGGETFTSVDFSVWYDMGDYIFLQALGPGSTTVAVTVFDGTVNRTFNVSFIPNY